MDWETVSVTILTAGVSQSVRSFAGQDGGCCGGCCGSQRLGKPRGPGRPGCGVRTRGRALDVTRNPCAEAGQRGRAAEPEHGAPVGSLRTRGWTWSFSHAGLAANAAGQTAPGEGLPPGALRARPENAHAPYVTVKRSGAAPHAGSGAGAGTHMGCEAV